MGRVASSATELGRLWSGSWTHLCRLPHSILRVKLWGLINCGRTSHLCAYRRAEKAGRPIPREYNEVQRADEELDAAMRSNRIEHDSNSVLEWCISNVVGRYGARSNVYARKLRPEQKVDAAIFRLQSVA
jgi:hypothetical protein